MELKDLKDGLDMAKIGFDLFKESIGLAKRAKDSLPDGAEKSSIEKSLDNAERAGKLAEAQIAKALGYHLCQCTFPPQIMLSIGMGEGAEEQFQCPNCKKVIAPDALVEIIDSAESDDTPW